MEIVGPNNREDRGCGNQKVIPCGLIELCHLASPLVLGAPTVRIRVGLSHSFAEKDGGRPVIPRPVRFGSSFLPVVAF